MRPNPKLRITEPIGILILFERFRCWLERPLGDGKFGRGGHSGEDEQETEDWREAGNSAREFHGKVNERLGLSP